MADLALLVLTLFWGTTFHFVKAVLEVASPGVFLVARFTADGRQIVFETAMGILRLQERRRVRLFVHREPYGRFVSCLVFIPRDRYTTQVREHIAQIATQALRGE